MKKYLITLAFVSTAFVLFSCNESDNDTGEMEIEISDETDDNGDSTDNENTPDDDMNEVEMSDDNDNQTDLVLTDCLACPSFTLTQVTTSGNNETIMEPAAEVCKGEDGKAYVAGVLNEEFDTYELYLQNRQMFGTRCN